MLFAVFEHFLFRFTVFTFDFDVTKITQIHSAYEAQLLTLENKDNTELFSTAIWPSCSGHNHHFVQLPIWITTGQIEQPSLRNVWGGISWTYWAHQITALVILSLVSSLEARKQSHYKGRQPGEPACYVVSIKHTKLFQRTFEPAATSKRNAIPSRHHTELLFAPVVDLETATTSCLFAWLMQKLLCNFSLAIWLLSLYLCSLVFTHDGAQEWIWNSENVFQQESLVNCVTKLLWQCTVGRALSSRGHNQRWLYIPG